MRQVAIFSSDGRLEDSLRTAGFRAFRLGPAGLAECDRAADPPTALVVDVRGHQQLPEGLAAFRRKQGSAGVVLVASGLEPRLMLEAMRAGISEYVHEPVTTEALGEAVRRVLVGAVAESTGQVLAFVGAKGGVGTTTLAVNTAAALAGQTRGVLLIDLHVGHGDAAVFLGVEPRFSVIDALENVHRVDESFFAGLVTKTRAGVDLLGPSDRLPPAPVDPRRLRTLLEFAVRQYRFTVIDVPRSDLGTLDVLEGTDRIVVVASQELSALRSVGRLAQTLRARYGGARVKAVVNRFDQQGEIARGDIDRVIGDSVKYLVPSDYRVSVGALNAGRPVVLEQGRLAESLRALATDLGGIVTAPSGQPSSMLGRLAFLRS